MKYEKTIICQECGKPFVSHTVTGKYCCEACRNKAGNRKKNIARKLARQEERAERTAGKSTRTASGRKTILSIPQAVAAARAHGLSYGKAVQVGLIS